VIIKPAVGQHEDIDMDQCWDDGWQLVSWLTKEGFFKGDM
jgi:hypothetical protein